MSASLAPLAPLASYRRVFSAPGSLLFTAAGLLARLSFAMNGVSTVVLIADRRGSYALAGAVSATGVVTAAVLMPLIGRLVDRHGQARVAVPSVLTSVVPLVGLLLCVRLGAPAWTLFLCWAASATAPNVGGMARARWAHLHRDDDATRHRANSLEQALDELCFMTGPVLAMALCTGLFPEAGLMAGGALSTVGVLLFAAQRRTEPPLAAPAATADSGNTGALGVLRVGGMPAMLLAFLAVGLLFGSLEVTTLAYADSLGRQSAAGVLLGLVAAGSAVSGLVFGMVRVRRSAVQRLVGGIAVMTLLMAAPLAAAASGGGLGVLGAALLVAGCGTAPTMVSAMTLVQDLLPAGRINEGMSLAVACILVGISTGSTVGGAIAQHAAPGTGYTVPVAAALLALAAALAVRAAVSPRREAAGRLG
ncbi:MFS transporter [Kitasatospora paracochleata]|uniref:MFS family permease n=1 Tax=Kitasatospora paracochleata TaxID=58354 RepID=A0ABT1J5P4_9ACTN|nr:MFS transporter [Kitasatospora paracochleata]MCP2312752.1 MFS family permease [Kitasatospora paracochleata]